MVYSSIGLPVAYHGMIGAVAATRDLRLLIFISLWQSYCMLSDMLVD